MKDILEDIVNILKIAIFMICFSSLYVFFKVGGVNLSILKSICNVVMGYFIPFYLPALVFFYFFHKYNLGEKTAFKEDKYNIFKGNKSRDR
ncbi:hypothetical protein [Avibacterium paragallinarum]|uniref:hypothetical protein n=1 Tax=Avibacterium paragallinarum TaxID=728 RepID=UPI00397D4E77